MSLWLFLAIIAQLLSALTVFIDKYVLVSKNGIKSPTALTFYTAMLSGSVLVLVPLGLVTTPTYEMLFYSIFSAILYITSLLFLYRALQETTVTNVLPLTASAGAFTTGALAVFFLSHDLPNTFIPAFLLLAIGTFLIYCFCFSRKLFAMALLAGSLVGASSFIAKLVFAASASFYSGLFWLLIMNVVVAVLLLAPTRFYAIKTSITESSSGVKWLVLLSRGLGGFSFFLTAIAINLGSVTIINALGGLQLVFLLILVPLFAHRIPDVFKYELTPETLILKVVGTVCIVGGLTTLFIF